MALAHTPADAFGALLKRWRGVRRMSQLALSLEAGISTRHLCCLETGKARPSRDMVLMLAEALDAPTDACNALLDAAGYAPAFRARPANDPGLALPLEALAWTLDRHAPYPAFAFDRHWRLVRANPPAARLLAPVGLGVGDSLLDALAPVGALRAIIENWAEVRRYMHARLRTEIVATGADPVLEAAAQSLAQGAPHESAASISAVLPVTYRLGDQRLSFFTTIAHFGGAQDLALTDLRIEHLFPADAPTKAALLAG